VRSICPDCIATKRFLATSSAGGPATLVDDVLGARQSAPIRPSDGSLLVVPQVTVGRFTSVGLAAEF
jgi:hypothetical protein